jgi:hypothetical protein
MFRVSSCFFVMLRDIMLVVVMLSAVMMNAEESIYDRLSDVKLSLVLLIVVVLHSRVGY